MTYLLHTLLYITTTTPPPYTPYLSHPPPYHTFYPPPPPHTHTLLRSARRAVSVGSVHPGGAGARLAEPGDGGAHRHLRS